MGGPGRYAPRHAERSETASRSSTSAMTRARVTDESRLSAGAAASTAAAPAALISRTDRRTRPDPTRARGPRRPRPPPRRRGPRTPLRGRASAVRTGHQRGRRGGGTHHRRRNRRDCSVTRVHAFVALVLVVAVSLCFGCASPAGPAPSASRRDRHAVADRQAQLRVPAHRRPRRERDLGLLPNLKSLLIFAGHDASRTTPRQRVVVLPVPASTTLRGQYSHNTKIWSNTAPNGGFGRFYTRRPFEDSTIATWLHSSGYKTGLFGKYSTGYSRTGAVKGRTSHPAGTPGCHRPPARRTTSSTTRSTDSSGTLRNTATTPTTSPTCSTTR